MHRPTQRAYTLAVLRQLQRKGEVKPRRRVGRVPKPIPPRRVEDEYTAALRRHVCELARACFEREMPEVLRALVDLRKMQGHVDAAGSVPIGLGRAAQLGKQEAERDQRKARAKSGTEGAELRHSSEQGKRAAAAIDRAAKAFANELRPHALHAVVEQFGKRTDLHSREQLDRQLRSAIGVPLSAIEKPSRDRLEGWTAANVGLIVTVPERYFDRLRGDVLDAFEGSTHPNTLAEQLQEDYEISERDAERIARDQILRINSQLTLDRMESIGVERAVWRTMNDGRVSEDCAALEGVEFNLAEGVPPEGVLPGQEHPMCRCYSAPILDDLIGE